MCQDISDIIWILKDDAWMKQFFETKDILNYIDEIDEQEEFEVGNKHPRYMRFETLEKNKLYYSWGYGVVNI